MTDNHSNNKLQHIAIAALGTDKPGLVSDISHFIFDYGCDIEDSRMIAMSGEFAVIVQVSGVWNAVAKLESSLPILENRLGLRVMSKRLTHKNRDGETLPYSIEVVALDHPGIVYNLANFFSEQNINIEELSTTCYSAAHTGAPMFSVHMEIGVPGHTKIAELKDSFLEYCDELNLDAAIEPVK